MYCPNCGTENDDTAGFCRDCGKELPHAHVEGGQGAETTYCPNCGAENRADALRCESCQRPLARHQGLLQGQGRPDIPNYLAQAILVTIFCCLPAGIVSIVYAAQVNGKLAGGDYEGARRSSKSAKTWAWVSSGVGIGIGALYLLVSASAVFGA